MTDQRTVWTRSLKGLTMVHLYSHAETDQHDRIVDGVRHWLTDCGQVPARYQVRDGDPIRSPGNELTQSQAERLALPFCPDCFPEKRPAPRPPVEPEAVVLSVRMIDDAVFVQLEHVVSLIRVQESMLRDHGLPVVSQIVGHLGDQLRDAWMRVGADKVMPGDLDV
ncbi:MAG TPA: hypothetical protein VIP06_02865 [Nocardioides sp.]